MMLCGTYLLPHCESELRALLSMLVANSSYADVKDDGDVKCGAIRMDLRAGTGFYLAQADTSRD